MWRGAFLLADYIYSHAAVFRDATVLELGAGTGLTSIIMATTAKMVYSTGKSARFPIKPKPAPDYACFCLYFHRHHFFSILSIHMAAILSIEIIRLHKRLISKSIKDIPEHAEDFYNCYLWCR